MVATADAPMGRATAAHLWRRAGFGATPAQLDEWSVLGWVDAVDRLVAERTDPDLAAIEPPTFRTAEQLAARDGTAGERQRAAQLGGEDRRALVSWWLRRMVATNRPLPEKLTWFWHGHFATSIGKVKLAQLLHVQHRTLAEHAGGSFPALVGAMVRDPAMLVWLDGRENRAGAPNENFARELFELFTLGHGGGHGEPPPYTESDVAEAARALTGWQIDPVRVGGTMVRRRHDGGPKTLFGRTGPWAADDVVTLVTQHPASAPHVVARLWSRFGRPVGIDDPVVLGLARDFVAGGLDMTQLVRAMLLHPEFRTPATRQGLLKTPVEWLVGAARALGRPVEDWWLGLLAGLGQVPFAPPDVAGWPENEGWLSTASARLRLDGAARLAAPVASDLLGGTRPADRPAAAARLLGVDGWSSPTAAALAEAADDPARLLTIALVAPDTLLN